MSITPESIIDDLENDRLPLPTLPEVAIRVRETADDDNASDSIFVHFSFLVHIYSVGQP